MLLQTLNHCHLPPDSPTDIPLFTTPSSAFTLLTAPASHEALQTPKIPSHITLLPPELLLRILELAILGRASFLRTRLLLATSLVARNWREPSQILLRSSVSIGSDQAVASVLPWLEGRWVREVKFERTARKLEREGVKQVLGCIGGVERLELDRVQCSAEMLMGGNMAGELDPYSALPFGCSADCLFTLGRQVYARSTSTPLSEAPSPTSLPSLPFSLRHLSLHASHANDPPLISALLIHSAQTLTSLTLKWGRYTSFDTDTLLPLITIAPQLQNLHLNLLALPTSTPPAELATLLARCDNLRSLRIEGLDIESLLPILTSFSSCTRLAVLELHFPLFYDLACAQIARSFHEALKLPAMAGLKRWRVGELRGMRMEEGKGSEWREECERRAVEIRHEKRVFAADG